MAERLQKLLARAGLGSRRHNEALIAAGRVRVNDHIARLGDKADPEIDRIEVDGLALKFEMPIYIKLYKPRGVLSSTEDELKQNRQTVRDLVKVEGHIYPVGRLDRQSEGLILLTNDGSLAHRLTHPRYGHRKVYRVAVDGQPSSDTLNRWRAGVELDGRRTAPAEIAVIHEQKDHSWLKIVLREGRKRQIRRAAAKLGHPVYKLVREEIGPLKLGNLSPGKWRHLTKVEIEALKESAARPPHPPKVVETVERNRRRPDLGPKRRK